MEPGLRGERVVEEGGDGSPEVELVEEVVPQEDQPLRVQQAEAAEQREQDGEAEPVPGEDRQGLEPVLKFRDVVLDQVVYYFYFTSLYRDGQNDSI